MTYDNYNFRIAHPDRLVQGLAEAQPDARKVRGVTLIEYTIDRARFGRVTLAPPGIGVSRFSSEAVASSRQWPPGDDILVP